MRFSRIEKGMYFRVDSVDTGDTTSKANNLERKATVIQYIIFFLSKRIYR